MKSHTPFLAHFCNRRRNSGAIMLITLIAMVLIMLSAMALIRSFETSQSMAGNLAFKRDLLNRAEQGMTQAIAMFDGGGALFDPDARLNNSPDHNYYAAMLATNGRGIPSILLSGAGTRGTEDINDDDAGISIRYVIDRLCSASGEATSSQCTRSVDVGAGSANESGKRTAVYRPVYRISVRASGPRNTQIFLQTTIRR